MLPAASLAARFAAKEALAKALGAPVGLHWRDAEVHRGEDGRPHLVDARHGGRPGRRARRPAHPPLAEPRRRHRVGRRRRGGRDRCARPYDAGHGPGRRAAAARGPARGHPDGPGRGRPGRGLRAAAGRRLRRPGAAAGRRRQQRRRRAARRGAAGAPRRPGGGAAAAPTGCTRPGSRRCAGPAAGSSATSAAATSATSIWWSTASSASAAAAGCAGARPRSSAALPDGALVVAVDVPSGVDAVDRRGRRRRGAGRRDGHLRRAQDRPARRPRRRARRRGRAGRHRARPADRPPSRCCRPTTSRRLLPPAGPRVGQVPPRRRRAWPPGRRSTPARRCCASAARCAAVPGMVRYLGADDRLRPGAGAVARGGGRGGPGAGLDRGVRWR